MTIAVMAEVAGAIAVIETGENTLAAYRSAQNAAASAANAEAFAGPTYASQAAGEAATVEGDFFAVNDAGIVTIYLRTAGGSTAQRTMLTTAALAATGGAALVGEAGGDTVQDALDALTARFGDFGGRVTDSASLTAALAESAARTPDGGRIYAASPAITLTGDFAMVRSTTIDFTGAQVTATPTARLFDFGWGLTGSGNQKGGAHILGGSYSVSGTGTTVVAVQNAGANTFRDMTITMQSASMVGFYLKGNEDPNAPYGVLIDGCRVRGSGLSTQAGIIIEALPVEGSLAPNRTVINNLMDCASLGVGVDIRGIDGGTGSNWQVESCSVAGIRFGHGGRTHSGTVTTVGAASSSFTDTALIGKDLDQASCILITSGPNAGHSVRIVSYNATTGVVVLPFAMPFQFTLGDAYTLYESKAREFNVSGVLLEMGSPSDATVSFKAGALACKVETSYFTQSGGNIFAREIEEISNTVAARHELLTFSKTLTSADGTETLVPGFISSTQGGLTTLEGGWIEAVYVTGATRGAATAGTITIEVIQNGSVLGSAMQPQLTEAAPNFGRRIRKALTASDFITQGQSIQARAVKSGMTLGETVQVTVLVGFMG